MKEQGFFRPLFMPDLKAVAEQNNNALKCVFKGRIKGCFLIDMKDQVLKERGGKYGSVYFRKNALLSGEEFLYYPLPYELFVLSSKMSQMLLDRQTIRCPQLYYGVIYNGRSVLSLLEGNLLGTAYPLRRGVIEMYLKLLILNIQTELYDQYEKFRMFEVEYSCRQTYPKEFNTLFEKRVRQDLKVRADYLHFG